MLVDKVIDCCPDLTIGLGGEKIKDTIVFYINENVTNFIKDGFNEFCTTLSLPSFLPYNNIFIQFNDSNGLWFTEAGVVDVENKLAEEKVVLFSAFSNEFHFSLIVEDKIVHSFYMFDFIPNEIVCNFNFVKHNKITEIEEDKDLHRFGHCCLVILSRFLSFLSCSNIRKVEHRCPNNKARIKKGKKPLISYYTLELNQQKTSGKNNKVKNLWTNRIHLCRGHFRVHTKDNPMFGKLVGKFWIKPHARGNKKKGIVVKDYSLST